MEKSVFRGRAFVSMLMACSVLVVALSGFALYAAPHGRAADWNFLSLGKREWTNLHIVFGILFPFLAAVHLGLNWKPFTGYLRRRFAENVVRKVAGHLRLELLAAVLVCFLLGFATLKALPPARTLLDLRTTIAGEPGGERHRGPPSASTEPTPQTPQ